ncbi:hypothetical protein G5C51_14225 [Streptomyces sp. A7024]|uniref:Uncharacterized protein n=1 Tax=Streptomyces coryli TaxID=1128680 RepID=A0A6G4U0Z2_9ACTN|nr:hypothetical protein [Streptomyces coryli]NGN65048.1 hypothetical protein [Streptomyces coryli]
MEPGPLIISFTTTGGHVMDTLRRIERVLLGDGQRTARRNAWNAVLEDRRRAKDRRETEVVMRATATRGAQPT